jgi:NTE family protein
VEAYAIFEGGGAKGYAHVGALKAAEERGIAFRKVAGTSAGAIVAALVAAGYTADELLDPNRTQGGRGVLDLDPLDILDRSDYGRIRRLMAAARRMRMPADKTYKCGLRGYLRRCWNAFARSPYGLLFGQTLLLGCHGRELRAAFRNFGMTGSEPLIAWLDRQLRNKLPTVSGQVTFGDLNMRLRVVAANLATGIVKEFGGPDDRDLPVAPAVVASACFPLFFRPLCLGDHMHVDGGLASNLPAWIFDDEREDDPTFIPTFGFRLVSDPLVVTASVAPASMVEFVQRVVQTTLSSTRRLEERRIDDYYAIDLTAQVPTLSFDDMRARAPELVSAARNCVERFFRENIGPQDPNHMSRVLRAAVEELKREYEWRDRVRAAIILPNSNRRWASTVYSAHMEHDGDDRLRVRLDGLGVGVCLHRREPVYIRRPFVDLAGAGVNKYEINARPSDIRYSYAIPIFDDAEEWAKENPTTRAEPFAALVIDKSDEVDALLLDEDQQDTLANLAAIIGEEVRDKSLFRKPHGRRGAPSDLRGWERVDSAGGVLVSRRKVRDVGDMDLGARLSRTIGRLGSGVNRRFHPERNAPTVRQPDV